MPHPYLIGDVDGDGQVRKSDLDLINKAMGTTKDDTWGLEEGQYNRDADLNGDGKIDQTDLSIAEEHFCHVHSHYVLNKDPLIWYRNAGLPENTSWRLIYQTHPHEWKDKEPITYEGEKSWNTLPTRGAYGKIKTYYGAPLIHYMPDGVGAVMLIQGRRPRKVTEALNGYGYYNGTPGYLQAGGHQFNALPVTQDKCDHKVVMKYRAHAIDKGTWFGVGFNIWGEFRDKNDPSRLKEVCLHMDLPPLDICTDTWEIIAYHHLAGLLPSVELTGVLLLEAIILAGFPKILPGIPSSYYIRGERIFHGDVTRKWYIHREMPPVVFESFVFDEQQTYEHSLWKPFELLTYCAKFSDAVVYLTGIEPLLEVLNGHGEIWFDEFYYLVPR